MEQRRLLARRRRAGRDSGRGRALFFGRVPAPTPPPLVQQPPVQLPPVEAEPTRPVTLLARDDGSTGWLATVDRRQSKC
ncbi:hypothetical protein LG3211_1825 [Lysobacter gummosus]|nr:hypothetical protein LG3211_1825 [Lysobacter gummosus]